jgi:hypothetical protein
MRSEIFADAEEEPRYIEAECNARISAHELNFFQRVVHTDPGCHHQTSTLCNAHSIQKRNSRTNSKLTQQKTSSCLFQRFRVCN